MGENKKRRPPVNPAPGFGQASVVLSSMPVYPASPFTKSSPAQISFGAAAKSWTFAPVAPAPRAVPVPASTPVAPAPRAVLVPASTPICALIPECRWFPFQAGFISGSRLFALFSTGLGASIIVASAIDRPRGRYAGAIGAALYGAETVPKS
jgi:hypothetical protein